MINFLTIYILAQLNVILNLKKEYDENLKNIPTVGEVWLRIDWKCRKIALIV